MCLNYNNIFLIDDDENVNFYNEDLLLEIDYVTDVKVHLDCFDALTFIDLSIKNNCVPGLWFVDINMPLMNGFQFIDKAYEKLRHLNTLPKIHMLSSSEHHSDLEECEKRNFIEDLLLKPLTNNNLVTIFNN